MKDLLHEIYYRLFLWSGSKLFPVVAIYDDGTEEVNVVHFAMSRNQLHEACTEMANEPLTDQIHDAFS